MRSAFLPMLFLLELTALPAQADIYGYLDSDGVEHFSTQKLDERYQLFAKEGVAFDSAESAPLSGASGTPVPPAPTKAGWAYLTKHPNLKKYESVLDQAAKDFSLEPALLKAVMAAESGFNPAAVSPKGAIGLMQIMPATAERYGLQGDSKRTLLQKLADPIINIRLGARYLRDLSHMFPASLHLVLASYNAGEGSVQKYNNQIPPYPETIHYVKLVTQFYHLYQPSPNPATVRATGPDTKRIRMTIPGRSNMPPSIE